MQIVIRPYEHEDKALVYSTMLRGLYYGNSFFRNVDQDVFFRQYQTMLDNTLFKRSNSLMVACMEEDPSVVLGWALYNSGANTLHYVYVKEAFRKMGIAKRLINITVDTVTHITDLGNDIRRAKGWSFNPWLI